MEDDWIGDGRWNFGVLGTFDRRVGLQRGAPSRDCILYWADSFSSPEGWARTWDRCHARV
ncbi:hypothetical protein FS749_002058 [Ceratobasidium sp. UAMH 11750]|nr:hypothetical protein FS749_002058 [Ceratobasidium sp. UAMH 11750]